MSSVGIKSYFQFSDFDWSGLWSASWETIWLTVISMIAVCIFGFLFGLLLFETRNSKSFIVIVIRWIVAAFVNIFRSIPFIILIVLLIPFTKQLMGTIIGAKAALPALIISATPFYARLVEIAFHEIDRGVLEAAKAMGASPSTIIFKVLLPESLPALVSGAAVTTISLIGFTAMAGAIGAGGLGFYAYNDGFQSGNNTIILAATVVILIIVFIFQTIGDFAVKRIDKREL